MRATINGNGCKYIRLKEKLNSDLFNSNWVEINTTRKYVLQGATYNFVDLFSGAGGLSLGFKKAKFNKVASSELDPDAHATNVRNFPNSMHFSGEIEKVTNKEILNAVNNQTIHVVCGGPPCQGFSVAGLRNPNDKRNLMFKQFVRIVDLLKPWFFVMENVPGILTISNGKVKNAILDEFSKIGYSNTSIKILEAATYGVPQYRARVIIVGNRFNLRNPYPKEILSPEEFKSIEEAIDDLKNMPRNPKINHEWTKHSAEYEKRISKVKPGESLYATFKDAFKRQRLGEPSMAVKENHGGTHIHPTLNRVISAREMARLQTFPDDFIFEGRMKRAMWQIGNAVPVLMAQHIALALRPSLEEIEKIV